MSHWNFYTTKEIKPAGWLRRQLQLQAEGLNGNLDKVWPDVRDSAWIGGDRDGWERVPYWLDGFIPLAYLLEDEDMIARAKHYIDAILQQQCEDGWICPCTKEARPTYDSWAVQLITKVLTVYYDCSGDERIPVVVYRILKNYYELLKNGTIQLFSWGKFRWFEACIAISFTYERCPEDWLIDLVRILKEQGADYTQFTESWQRPLNWWRFETHIVNLCMMLKSEAVSAQLLGEPYCDLAEQLRTVLDKYNGTVYESFTGDECLSGLSPIQGTELCAIVEQMYSYSHLFAATGDSKWAQRLEVLAFNALPATISEDMWTHQYDQQSNQIACIRFPGRSVFRTNSEDAHLFGLEPSYGCCTANFGQGWPKFALNAFFHNRDTVVNAMLLPSELNADGIHIRLDTDYPFRNQARYTIEADKAFTFRIRIPSFARKLTVNGEARDTEDLVFSIRPGKTEITLSFDVPAEYVTRPHDLAAVKAGSLLFSLPISYEPKMLEYERDGVARKFPYCDYELHPTSSWNYGYCGSCLEVERNQVGAAPFSSETPPVTVKTRGQKINWGYADGYDTVCAKVPESREPISEPEEIILHPYGCSKLRMTELPILE